MFYFDLPAHLISQHPPEKRGQSRLMALDRSQGKISHHNQFPEILDHLTPNDVIFINNTRE